MLNPKKLEKFRMIVERVVAVPESEWRAFIPHLSERVFKKEDFLVRAGTVMPAFYFIISGLVRYFYSTEDGKEFNKAFAMENGFAASYHSLALQEPCVFFIQALEKTETLVLPCPILNQFYDRHPCWERLGRKNAEWLALVKESREKELLLDSLEIRYHRFLKEFPGLADRIPQYHIASYLGVTDVALSRLRKKITRQPKN